MADFDMTKKEIADYCRDIYLDESLTKKQVTDRLRTFINRHLQRIGVAKVTSKAGTNCNKPTSPRSQALDVSSYMCQATATISIWLDIPPSSRPTQNRTKPRHASKGRRVGTHILVIPSLQKIIAACTYLSSADGKKYLKFNTRAAGAVCGGVFAVPATQPMRCRRQNECRVCRVFYPVDWRIKIMARG